MEYVHNRQVQAVETFNLFYSYILLNVKPNCVEWSDALQVVHFRSLEKPKEEDFSLELYVLPEPLSLIVEQSIIVLLLSSLTLFFIVIFRSKLHTYDDVVEKLAHHIGLENPTKIRLTAHNCYSQQPRAQPIKYRGVEHLTEMLTCYDQVSASYWSPLLFNSLS